MNYFTHDGDDDMSLADMMSMKINVSSPNANDKKVIFWVGFYFIFFNYHVWCFNAIFMQLIFNSFSKKKRERERETDREKRSHGIII